MWLYIHIKAMRALSNDEWLLLNNQSDAFVMSTTSGLANADNDVESMNVSISNFKSVSNHINTNTYAIHVWV